MRGWPIIPRRMVEWILRVKIAHEELGYPGTKCLPGVGSGSDVYPLQELISGA